MTIWGELCTTTVDVELVDGTWTDITAFALGPGDRGQEVGLQRGRQNELVGLEPSRLATLVLRNDDGRFTPGNVSSPYWPNWVPGKRIRWRETIGPRTFDLFVGYLQVPEGVIQTEGLDQTVVVTAVDRLGRLDVARTFLSTLGEYILAAGGDLLQAYWPLLEGGGTTTFRDYLGSQPPLVAGRNDSSLAGQATAEPTYTPGGGATAPGEDAGGVLFTPSTAAGTGGVTKAKARAWALVADTAQTNAVTPPTRIRLHAGELLTIVGWFAFDQTVDDAQGLFNVWLADEATKTAFTALTFARNSFSTLVSNPGKLEATLFIGLSGSVASGATFGTGSPLPLAVQLSYSPNTLRIWAGSNEYVAAAPSGTPADPQILYPLLSVGSLAGTAAHLQLYVGNYTRAMYLAQLDAGWTGLAYQTSGQRLRTLARYAGIDEGDLAVDDGVAVMQRARLAGRKPAAVMREVEATERGRLFCAGDCTFTFHDRKRIHNI
jgi:hypothetical protein